MKKMLLIIPVLLSGCIVAETPRHKIACTSGCDTVVYSARPSATYYVVNAKPKVVPVRVRGPKVVHAKKHHDRSRHEKVVKLDKSVLIANSHDSRRHR